MSTITVSAEEFGNVLEKLMKEYGEQAFKICEDSAKTAARQGTSALKRSAPAGGSYARGWSHKALRASVTGYTEVIYNRTNYQLTHLLEKPHSTGGGGHYPKNVDYTGNIAKVEEEYGTKFYEGVIEKL